MIRSVIVRGAANLALAGALFLFFWTRPYTDLLPFLLPHRCLPGLPGPVPPLLLLCGAVFWLGTRTGGGGWLFSARVSAVVPVVLVLSVPLVPEVMFDKYWILSAGVLFLFSPVLMSAAFPVVWRGSKSRKAGFILLSWMSSISFVLFVFLLLLRGNTVPLSAFFALAVCSFLLAHSLSGGHCGLGPKLLVVVSCTALLLALALSLVNGGAKREVFEAGQVRDATGIVVGPYLQNMQKTSVTVMWETKVPLTGRVVVSEGREVLSVFEKAPGLARGAGLFKSFESPGATLHEVLVDGLMEKTRYYYRVLSNGVAGEIGSFQTSYEGSEPFDFAVYGDSQEMFGWAEYLVRNRHREVCASILSHSPQTGFVVHVGDMTFLGNERERWGREFFGPARKMMLNMVVWPVIGNHEKNAASYFDYFSVPNEDEHYYSFDYGNSRFIVLAVEGYAVGHEYGPPTRTPMDPGSPQYEWLKKTLESSQDKTWRFVFFHQSPFSSGLEGGYTPARTILSPLFEQYGVTVVFSGHDHTHEVSVKDKVVYVVTGGGGGPVSPLQPDIRSNPYSRYFRGDWHHCRVHVAADQVEVQAVDLKGRVFHSVKINKGRGLGILLKE